ncbi:hypothetical protein [Burkholderia cepacia]
MADSCRSPSAATGQMATNPVELAQRPWSRGDQSFQRMKKGVFEGVSNATITNQFFINQYFIGANVNATST